MSRVEDLRGRLSAVPPAVIGIASGIALSIGVLVLLQQFSVRPLTVRSLGGAIVVGVLLGAATVAIRNRRGREQ